MKTVIRFVVASLCVAALPLFAQAPRGSLTAWGEHVTSKPIPVALPAGVSMERVAAGQNNTIAVATDGVTVYTWSGLGNATSAATTPSLITLSDTIYIQCVTQVAAGDGHFLALANAADLFAWGMNSHRVQPVRDRPVAETPIRVVPPRVDAIVGERKAVLRSGRDLRDARDRRREHHSRRRRTAGGRPVAELAVRVHAPRKQVGRVREREEVTVAGGNLRHALDVDRI
jgi:hypothetical protein